MNIKIQRDLQENTVKKAEKLQFFDCNSEIQENASRPF